MNGAPNYGSLVAGGFIGIGVALMGVAIYLHFNGFDGLMIIPTTAARPASDPPTRAELDSEEARQRANAAIAQGAA